MGLRSETFPIFPFEIVHNHADQNTSRTEAAAKIEYIFIEESSHEFTQKEEAFQKQYLQVSVLGNDVASTGENHAPTVLQGDTSKDQ